MNAEQKQRAKDALTNCQASDMAALLQELIDSPEAEPVAKTTGYYGGHLTISTVDGRVLPFGTALYLAPPAPIIVPDGWRLVPYTPTVLMLERAAYAVNNRPQPSKYEPSATPAIIFWTAMLNYAPEAPQDAEPPADAERLDWLDERNAPHGLGWEIIQMPAGNVHIHTLTGDKAKFESIRDAIDAAIERQGGES